MAVLWTYSVLGFPVAFYYHESYSMWIKWFLVNVLVTTVIVASKFRVSIVTRSFVWCCAFVLSANILWAIPVTPWTMPAWELCSFITCTVILGLYPWCYASFAMKERSGVMLAGEDTSFGTTKRGVIFLPLYRPTMIFSYCIWNTLFVIYYSGDISALPHNVSAVLVAVLIAWVEKRSWRVAAFFWPVARGLTLACWMTTWVLTSNHWPMVASNEVLVGTLRIILPLVTVIGVVDFVWLYITEKRRKSQEGSQNMPVVHENGVPYNL